MRKLVLIFILFTITATGQEFWSGAYEKDWKNKNKDGVHWLVWVLNPQTTNKYYTTNGIPYYVTNYTHTAENTNNVLNGINWNLTNNATGENAFEHGYDVEKCGGFDIYSRFLVYSNWAENNKKWTVSWNVSRDEFRQVLNVSASKNKWYTNNIPYVDDIKKARERRDEYLKEKQKK